MKERGDGGANEEVRFRELFAYLVDRFWKELGLSPHKRHHTTQLSEAAKLTINTAKKYLDISKKSGSRGPNSKTRPKLLKFLRDGVSDASGIPNFQDSWLNASSVRELENLIDSATLPAQAPVTEARETNLALTIPARPWVLDRLTRELCHHYVSYRFAFEAGTEDKLAREVITFSPGSDLIRFTMSFRFNETDKWDDRQVYEGTAMPLGQSVMCVGTYSDGNDFDRDRGRSIFFRRSEFEGAEEVRFGIISTTRALPGFEPCAACILMLRVDADIKDDKLAEFRRRVTSIRPLQEILDSDFSSLKKELHTTKELRANLEKFLDNRPKGADTAKRDDGRDRILKLWYGRFEVSIPKIVTQTYRNVEVKAPFKRNWGKSLLEK